METDADRLESIKALGGQLVHTAIGKCWAIFDEDASQVAFDNVHINSNSPQLTLRASDAIAHALDKRGTAVEISGSEYSVRERAPTPAPGWIAVLLDAA